VAWRGLSVEAPGIQELTYWDRKTAAEQIGKGGVTELLLELEHAVNDAGDPNKNVYLVTGHSFGAGIVLSALNEILLERVVTAPQVKGCDRATSLDCACVETRPFGHGVVLLNPAIEANEAFQLKEAVAERCFGPNQVRLMHVISSDADRATNKVFRVGQWLGMLKWKEAQLLNDGASRGHEYSLDTFTVGNYLPFQPVCRRRLNGRPSDCVRESGAWDYVSYAGRPECVPMDDRLDHIPVRHNEPLAFIQTDDAFIGDHSDVFTNNVAGYLAAIVVEAACKRASSASESADRKPYPDGCVKPTQIIRDGCVEDDKFDFGVCFNTFRTEFVKEKG
jgi:hypothetical protein